MRMLADAHSDRIIADILHFGSQIAHSEKAFFFWLDDDCELSPADAFNMPDMFTKRYSETIRPLDPLNTPRLASEHTRFAMLNGDIAQSSRLWHRYTACLNEYSIADELDMLFWAGSKPVAGLALYRSGNAKAFANDAFDWDSMHAHFEYLMQMHWRVRSEKVRTALSLKFNLQPREIDVVDILVQGASNAEIAETLSISVSTVKSHIVSILDKMGAFSRTEISYKVNLLQFS